jgi:hypothetical protein
LQPTPAEPANRVESVVTAALLKELPPSNLLQRLLALLPEGRVIVSNDLACELTVTERHYCSLTLDGLAHLVRLKCCGVAYGLVVTHTR